MISEPVTRKTATRVLAPRALPVCPSLLPTPTFISHLPCREGQPGWDREIAEVAEDTLDECFQYGPVVHVHVDRASRGCVYVVSHEMPGRTLAATGLHRRASARVVNVSWGWWMAGLSPPLTAACAWQACALIAWERKGRQAYPCPRGGHPAADCCANRPAAPAFQRPQQFRTVQSAAAAQKALGGRVFAGRQVTVDFQVGTGVKGPLFRF